MFLTIFPGLKADLVGITYVAIAVSTHYTKARTRERAVIVSRKLIRFGQNRPSTSGGLQVAPRVNHGLGRIPFVQIFETYDNPAGRHLLKPQMCRSPHRPQQHVPLWVKNVDVTGQIVTYWTVGE